MNEVRVCEVQLWGKRVGAVSWDENQKLASFQYDAKFVSEGWEVAPLRMPRNAKVIYRFPALKFETFQGLPGLLADSLPDYFGNQVINTYLQSRGREPDSMSPIEKLCYVGQRGMGALEFRPALPTGSNRAQKLNVSALAELAEKVLRKRETLQFEKEDSTLSDLLQVGSSAGGARAKGIIAWNRETNEIRSGQVEAPPGFEYWLIKFASSDEHREYGRIELAYSLMARAAGIQMSECRLWEQDALPHFMTRRFDRTADGKKLHVQSLCALGHYDFNQRFENTYESAFYVMQRLGIHAEEELFRRVAFNLVTRNQDDHTRNLAFLMTPDGNWALAPAFDVTWAFQPQNPWTSTHQMSLGGKRDAFTRHDLLEFARKFDVPRAETLLDSVLSAAARLVEFTREAGLADAEAVRMLYEFRMNLGDS